MARWCPEPIWEGEDAYIIGGGPSLRGFPWGTLRGRNTIGCNSAFILGAHVVDVLIFGDLGWWAEIGSKQLSMFGGIIVGSLPPLGTEDRARYPKFPPWVLEMERDETKDGLSTWGLCWNGNTGSLAINLALRLGARRVFLLGFDMKMDENQNPNWHTVRYEAGNHQCYVEYKRTFRSMVAKGPLDKPEPGDLQVLFPGREIINVTDCSTMDVFPRVGVAEHFGWPK